MNTREIIFDLVTIKHGQIGVVTLNKPAQLNALNHHMIQALSQYLSEWQENKTVKAVVIKATPGRAFCAGGDLKITHTGIKQSLQTIDYFFKEEYKLNALIHHYNKPYVALLNGITMGGGAGISIHGSYRIGTEHILFAMPETGIGFFPDVGGSYFLSRLPDAIGMYLGLTGDRIKLSDCLRLGLLTHFIPESQLENCLQSIIEADYSKHNAHETIHSLLKRLSHSPIQAPELTQHHLFINKVFSLPRLEDILQELHTNTNPLAEHALKLINKNSPTSLKVTFRALKISEQLRFDECMQMEVMLAQHFARGHDFLEGIRAAVLDKDRSPNWNPATLSHVRDELIDAYFSPFSASTDTNQN